MSDLGPSPRVRVTAPATARRRRTTVVSELDAQSPIGEVYLRSLLRSQLRLALGITAILVLTVGALPLAFALIPSLRHAHVLAWILLGGCCYPVLIGLGIAYVRRAERNEQHFHELVDR
ncbi:hypothetical protein [Nocardioides sp. Kera G14]|uniref:hypothetical protein n=1 Tax=Nocardioides sp. Kera G14 TaxID=2884264 RepID=UPI001D11BA52|nr:hypothetical protein [Nocardioides sp. Kera G14]UDY23785.1 hypothetical protein LH076_00360 [Nocardioides sp. Kera G14]